MFVTNFSSTNGQKSAYEKKYGVTVNDLLDYEIGEIKTNESSFPVMFIKRKEDSSQPKIELLVIYRQFGIG